MPAGENNWKATGAGAKHLQMRTHLEFRSRDLLDADSTKAEPRGESVAKLLAGHLPGRGVSVHAIEPEDWGWRVVLKNDAFPLWIGCGHYEEYPDGHLCFIEPSQPYVRQWLKRISTSETVEGVATAMEEVLRVSGKVSDLRWWTEAEINFGKR